MMRVSHDYHGGGAAGLPGLPGRLRRLRGQEVRPVRCHDRHRTIHALVNQGHDPGAVLIRRPRVLGR